MAVSRRLLAALVFLGFAGFSAGTADASRVRGLGLADMAARGGKIFVGTCTARTVSPDPATGVLATTYTFDVTDPIKGVGAGPTTFRIPGTPDRPLIPDLATFEIEERALLILYPESRSGFSSAMGLDQGRFRIVDGPRGPTAVNGLGNERLLRDVPEEILESHDLTGRTAEPLPLDALVRVLRAMTAESLP